MTPNPIERKIKEAAKRFSPCWDDEDEAFLRSALQGMYEVGQEFGYVEGRDDEHALSKDFELGRAEGRKEERERLLKVLTNNIERAGDNDIALYNDGQNRWIDKKGVLRVIERILAPAKEGCCENGHFGDGHKCMKSNKHCICPPKGEGAGTSDCGH